MNDHQIAELLADLVMLLALWGAIDLLWRAWKLALR